MIENVTIIDKNGNGIIAEGLMYIEIKSINQKYVFYTLKEMVDNERIKELNREIIDEFIDVVLIGKINPETNEREIDIEMNVIKLD